MKSITISVQFDDFLAITLPRNVRHFTETLVVTSPDDVRTQSLAKACGAQVFVTDAFYRDGAIFNKGLAMEEGFDQLGRDDWIVVWDADTLMPDLMDFSAVEPGNLYCPRRRVCRNPIQWNDGQPWSAFLLSNDREHAGYFQLFHAGDPVLRLRPWYGTNWRHAGGCDSDFQAKWPENRKKWLGFEVLHLGPIAMNWYGRATPRIDGAPIPEAEDRARAHRVMMLNRKPGYRGEKLDEY